MGNPNGGSEQGLEVGDLVCVWRLGRGIMFWGWFVVLGTGQQKSEGGERKQEREDQRPTDSRKKEALRARGLRLGGLTPLPAVAQHSLPPSPQGWCRVIELASGVWALVGGRVFGNSQYKKDPGYALLKFAFMWWAI